MSDFDKIEAALETTLIALGDGLEKLVLVGGWLPFIYCQYLWKMNAIDIPQTTDIDLGVRETGSFRYPTTLFEKLKKAGLAARRIHPQEATPLQFYCKIDRLAVRIDFLTSDDTSDDTRNRFLGKELAWSRLAAFDVLLEGAVPLALPFGGKTVTVSIPPPARFFYHKGVIFSSRDNDYKKGKDLYTFWWGLKFAPDPAALMREILDFKSHSYFGFFAETLEEYFKDAGRPGYALLAPFLKSWVPAKDINREIRTTVQPFLEVLKKKV